MIIFSEDFISWSRLNPRIKCSFYGKHRYQNNVRFFNSSKNYVSIVNIMGVDLVGIVLYVKKLKWFMGVSRKTSTKKIINKIFNYNSKNYKIFKALKKSLVYFKNVRFSYFFLFFTYFCCKALKYILI